MSSSTIEINGKRYDSRTGAQLDGSAAPKPAHSGHSMDGVSRPLKKHTVLETAVKTIQPEVALSQPPKSVSIDGISTPRKPGTTHKRSQQGSQTLMRTSVKKPAHSLKRNTKVHSNLGAITKQPAHTIATKKAVHAVDTGRQARAGQTPKSAAVKKFIKPAAQPVPLTTPTPAPVPVSAHPPLTPQAYTKTAATRTTADILEQAIQHANSHDQPEVETRRKGLPRSLTAISLGLVAGFVMLGFIVTQNMNDIKLQLASSKAGFSAQLPGYQAPGFSLGNISANAGVVATRFTSNSDDRTYTVTQKNSAWNSDTLRDNFVVKQGNDYQTVEAAGMTIYLYGNHQASWVSGGIWYQVQSDGSLSDKQLVDLASSL